MPQITRALQGWEANKVVNHRDLIKSAVATGCSVLICLSTLFAAPLSARATGDNGWQVVSGLYDSSHKTSEGIATGQLANYSYVESPDGSVRLTKTVEPTGVEDEFIVQLALKAKRK